MDRDTGETVGTDGSVEDDVELEVNMFAYLRSVAGEVAVIPNGDIAKWSSKKKVPIAGYLCTTDQGPVLHTLPTPCLPTSIDENGEPFAPPVTSEDDAVGKPVSDPYHVWVGTTLLEFRSKPKAERFCKRLTKRIADDMGDAEWDAERLIPKEVDKKDMSVSNFMALARTPEHAWTHGVKSVLVVVMDWMRGDSSKAPYSKQTQTPKHYKDKVFNRVAEAFKAMSYGQFSIDVTVVPEVVRFTKPRSRYTAGGYPFPGIYNGAKDSMAGNRRLSNKYNFDKYDLVYVISPQQAPTGTKGVAWVGAKGAMCNGCEEISENFQVMVAVHELGHNLGLSHASSKSLEYGNVFDWMGNYPDVTGLSYGLGYKLSLGWLPQATVAKISDTQLSTLNDEYHLMPFDSSAAPKNGQLTGIQIDISRNKRYLYVAFRNEPGTGRAGIFLTMQERNNPNSELIDCACHSPSQQDAALQEGWTYMDPSGKVVIHAQKIKGEVATVRIYKAPHRSSEVAAIRGRKGFTDGQWKCPRVCTDADLLVSQFKGCSNLAKDGYCSGGSITMGGKKFSIGGDLCPKSCDQCDAVTSGSSVSGSGGGCADKNVKISGMDCGGCAAKGYCDYSTNIGHIGNDLCPKSCGNCPVKPTAFSSSSSFTDPTPVRAHGKVEGAEAAEAPAAADTDEDKNSVAAEKEKVEEDDAETDEVAKEKKAEAESPAQARDTCTDDPAWKDGDGDGCKVYAAYINKGKLTQDEACNYGPRKGPKIYCRKTCNSCRSSGTCEDKQCVTRWKYERGKCYACNEWKSHCGKDFFAHDCPRTCGKCKSIKPEPTEPPPTTKNPPTTTQAPTAPPPSPSTPPPKCEDDRCVKSWLKSTGACLKCADFAGDYCGRDQLFMKSCPKSCKICVDGKPPCHDDFLPQTCKRYVEWGLCSVAHISDHCKNSCGLCAGAAAANMDVGGAKLEMGLPSLEPILKGAAVRHASAPLYGIISILLLCIGAPWR